MKKKPSERTGWEGKWEIQCTIKVNNITALIPVSRFWELRATKNVSFHSLFGHTVINKLSQHPHRFFPFQGLCHTTDSAETMYYLWKAIYESYRKCPGLCENAEKQRENVIHLFDKRNLVRRRPPPTKKNVWWWQLSCSFCCLHIGNCKCAIYNITRKDHRLVGVVD